MRRLAGVETSQLLSNQFLFSISDQLPWLLESSSAKLSTSCLTMAILPLWRTRLRSRDISSDLGTVWQLYWWSSWHWHHSPEDTGSACGVCKLVSQEISLQTLHVQTLSQHQWAPAAEVKHQQKSSPATTLISFSRAAKDCWWQS
jgi:hypothetical protein